MAVNVFPAAGGGGAGELDRNYKVTSAGTYTVDIPKGLYYGNADNLLAPVTIGTTRYNFGYSTGGALTFPGNRIVISDDVTSVTIDSGLGYTYVNRTNATTMPPRSVGYGNGLFVIGHNSAGFVSTSTDGITWTQRTTAISGEIKATTYTNSIWVQGSNAPAIQTSTDGITWTSRTHNFGTSSINNIQGNGSVIVAVGDGGTIRTSTDGITWTTRTSNTTSTINSLAWGSGVFVTAGNGGQVRTSTDGITWTTRASGTTTALSSVRFRNNIFILGGDGYLRTSTDGITWTSRQQQGTVTSTEYINGYYVVYNTSGNVYGTTNFITWEQRPNINFVYNNGTVLGDNVLIAVSQSGAGDIYYSPKPFGTQYLTLWGQGQFTDLV